MTQQLPKLTPEEVRVLGCLIEKSQATPEYYPMTLNALVTACNQKTSREPVVDYDDQTVEDALTDLRSKGLVAFASGTGRALKYMHRAGQNGLGLSPAQATVMSIIMLRGPQTAGEIKARSGRQFNYPSVESVQHAIDSLIEKEHPYLEEAPRMVGQKEVRYRHLFYSYDDAETGAEDAPESHRSLRKEIEGLKDTIRHMQKDLTYLRNVLTAIQGDVMGMQEDLYEDDMGQY
ncbi:MAG: YceH family protein [Bacteroidetes bacterium]|nr:YceH family protein [Bacteroidota bacterium]